MTILLHDAKIQDKRANEAPVWVLSYIYIISCSLTRARLLFSPNICKCDIDFIQQFSKQEDNIVLHFTQNIVSIVANKATAELLCLSKKLVVSCS